MKHVALFVNPNAGHGDTAINELVSKIEKAGYVCRYSSTKMKHKWPALLHSDPDLIVLAGGDGTVRKITRWYFKQKKSSETLPFGLLPLGTANNIAKTLELKYDIDTLIKSWSHDVRKKFDLGAITGLEETDMFLEAVGFGIFPKLMEEMKKNRNRVDDEDPELKVLRAQEMLYDLIKTAETVTCEIELDGEFHSGKFLLAEIMNTRSIGPNICLAPLADPGDGKYDVVLIGENQREEFAQFVMNKTRGVDEPFQFSVLKASKLRIVWHGADLHVDDALIKTKNVDEIQIELNPGALEFLTPNQ